MPPDNSVELQIAQHTLRISDPDVSLPFYRDKLGMTLLTQREQGTATHFFLGFVEPGDQSTSEETNPSRWETLTTLELVYDPARTPADIRQQPDSSEGYWKIAISVPDVDIARDRLVSNGIDVDTPRQVPDVAYLCHCNDPDNYCIEFIQHDFQQNHKPVSDNADYALGTEPTFSLITYRVKNVETSLEFYSDVLGMRLLSKQVVKSRGFTLYFLACTTESPPLADIESVHIREWLWQRPYTMVEFQHIWGTEDQPDFAYRTGPESGFESLSFSTKNLDSFLKVAERRGHTAEICELDPLLQRRTATISDPDGFTLRIVDRG